jgi:hypothetical protein
MSSVGASLSCPAVFHCLHVLFAVLREIDYEAAARVSGSHSHCVIWAMTAKNRNYHKYGIAAI